MTAAGLATGNAVILKPAEQSPAARTCSSGALHESGVPASALALLPGDGDVGAALVRDPRVHTIAFTGSSKVGLEIVARRRRDPARPAAPEARGRRDGRQELRDRRLRRRPRRRRAGDRQVGVPLRRPEVLGLRARARPRGDRRRAHRAPRRARSRRCTSARPTSFAIDVPPVIEQAAQERVARYAAEAERSGRVAARARRVPDGGGWFAAPTLAADLPPDSPVLSEEIFGPLLAIERVREHRRGVRPRRRVAVRAHRRPVRAQPGHRRPRDRALTGRQPVRQPRDHRRDGRRASRSAATASPAWAPRPAGPATCCSSSSRAWSPRTRCATGSSSRSTTRSPGGPAGRARACA